MHLNIQAMGCIHLSPKIHIISFGALTIGRLIDMSEILRIGPDKLKVSINIFTCLLIILLLLVPFTTAISTTDGDYQAVENDSYTIGVQAYIYGLAPVMMQRTENLFVTMSGMGHAPVNQMGYSTHLVDASFTDVVTLTQIRFTILHFLNWERNRWCCMYRTPMDVTMSNSCLMRTRIPSTAWVDVPLEQEKALLPSLDLVGTAACPQDSR